MSRTSTRRVISPSSRRVSVQEEELEFQWRGKKEAKAAACSLPVGRLTECPRERIGSSRGAHEFIESENLEAMKLLIPDLENQVKMIYIDPPYNTGRDFVFRDQPATRSGATRRARSGRHAAWLSMMYPRLVAARRLLNPQGVLFASIDDVEQAHLTLLLNEIFGEENRVGTLVWTGGRKNDSRLVSVSHEYMLCYAKDRKSLAGSKATWRERKAGLDRIYSQYELLRSRCGGDHALISAALKQWYAQLPDGDPAKAHAHYCKSDERGVYFADNLSWPGGGGPTYPVAHPLTGRPCKTPSRGWVFADAETMRNMIKEDRIDFGPDENKVPTRKRYLRETEGQSLHSVFYQDGRSASQRLTKMFGKKVFDHPKDERVLGRLVRAVTGEGDLLMDFFAGSGTFGHAVLAENEKDGRNRRFVLIQQPESTGWDDYPNIAEVAKERLRRVAEQLQNDRNPQTPGVLPDLGIRVFRWTSAPGKPAETPSAENPWDREN
ncbi:MAG: site-specific DNA-methyltransferase [Planctomycetales bacterium]